MRVPLDLLSDAQGDVADPAAVRAAADEAQRRWGDLNGVFHAAGVLDERLFGAIPSLDRASCDAHFRPKVLGLCALEEALRDRPIDFVVLFSSIASVAGGLGHAAYAAANACLDAYAGARGGGRVPWISVNWDAWEPPGGASAGARPGEARGIRRTDGYRWSSGLSIRESEGADACARLLAGFASSQIVVSTAPLDIDPPNDRAAAFLPSPAPAGTSPAGPARRELPTPYAPPSTETQKALARIWGEVLGVPDVGIHDDFLELGGHSLMAIRIAARAGAAFGVSLNARALFDAPTISRLAGIVEAARGVASRG